MNKVLSARIDAELMARIRTVADSHRVGSITETVEWALRFALGELAVHELLRFAWENQAEDAFGKDSVMTVAVSGSARKKGGADYPATVTIDGKQTDLFIARVSIGKLAGDLEVLLCHPDNEKFPTLVFAVLPAAELEVAIAQSERKGSDGLSVRLSRKLSEITSLPIWEAPGSDVPDIASKVEV